MKQSIQTLHIEPSFDKKEADAIYEYVLSGAWLTEFKKTRKLEDRIAEFLDVKYCFMVPNGTMALYVACFVLYAESVTVPDFTMIASPNAVEMAGGKVYLVDVDRETLCVSSGLPACNQIVMPVDINGRCPDYEEFVPVVKQVGVSIIEDAAQAFGSFYQGKALGTFGDIGCFSFSPHKIISMGQGGCIVTNDDGIAEEIRRFKNFGRDTSGGYNHKSFGVNLKFTDLQAVVGLEQMKKLPKRIQRKREIFAQYFENLKDHVEFLPTDLTQTTPWYVDILTPHRDYLAEQLKAVGIGTQKFYPAIHQTFYGIGYNGEFPVAEEVSQKGLWLPSSVTLRDWEIDHVCEWVVRILEGMPVCQ